MPSRSQILSLVLHKDSEVFFQRCYYMCINRTEKLNYILPQHLEVPRQVFKPMWTCVLLHVFYFYTEQIHPDTDAAHHMVWPLSLYNH